MELDQSSYWPNRLSWLLRLQASKQLLYWALLSSQKKMWVIWLPNFHRGDIQVVLMVVVR